MVKEEFYAPSHFQVFWVLPDDAQNPAGPADSNLQLHSVFLPAGPCSEISMQFLSVLSSILVLAEKRDILTLKTLN